jgi:hypothetical protein
MKDETYVFVSDVREKSSTARSAKHTRTHNGKRGGVKFPSDYLTKKEKEAMSGEVKSYRLNEPMSWREFKEMPGDIQEQYIKLLRERYKVPYEELGKMFGISRDGVQKYLSRNGLDVGKPFPKGSFLKEEWFAWRNGVKVEKEAEIAEEPIVEQNEPVQEEKPVQEDKPVEVFEVCTKAIPCSGTLTFYSSAKSALETVAAILGNKDVAITISWEELT